MKHCPCKLCYGTSDMETRHPDKRHCQKYNEWYDANRKRGNIMSPISIDYMDEEGEENAFYQDMMGEDLTKKEIWDLIDEHLPAQMRSNYLRLREGVPGVSEEERGEVLAEIQKILKINQK